MKRRFTQNLHGATSQKQAFFIVIAVKTSNLTYNEVFRRQNVMGCLTFEQFYTTHMK
jgi:hypothetical protein